MGLNPENPIVGGTALRIPQIQSPNYDPGLLGWIIKIDGSAEFNNLTVRGTFMGADFIINSAGIFLYSGTPATGNLIGSWASASGTDAYSNTYPQGLSIGNNTTRQIVLNYNGSTASINFSVNNGHAQTAGEILEGIVNSGLANEYLSLQAIGPSVKTYTDRVSLLLSSQNEDGSSDANAVIQHSAAGNLLTIDPVAMTTAVPVTSYAGNAFTTYVPAVTGGGTATFTTQTGWSQRVGKMRFFTAYLVVNAAGSGAANVQIDAPVNIDRTTRQVVTASFEGLSAGNGNGQAVSFVGGTGATFDRLRSSTGTNITGANLSAGALITVSGWIREA